MKAYGKCKSVNAGKRAAKHAYVPPSSSSRVTVGGDTRTTVGGDTRTVN
jgi:hypothetical protein